MTVHDLVHGGYCFVRYVHKWRNWGQRTNRAWSTQRTTNWHKAPMHDQDVSSKVNVAPCLYHSQHSVQLTRLNALGHKLTTSSQINDKNLHG